MNSSIKSNAVSGSCNMCTKDVSWKLGVACTHITALVGYWMYVHVCACCISTYVMHVQVGIWHDAHHAQVQAAGIDLIPDRIIGAVDDM